MQALDLLLFDGLDRHGLHVGATSCLHEGSRVGTIGLVALDVLLHVVRR
jgi:hypothetical protein